MTSFQGDRRFSGHPARRSQKRGTGGRRPRKVRLGLETLETRLALSTYHVTSLGGGNSGSGTSGTLRYLIDNVATDGDTIVFDVSGTINITGSVSIDHNVSIDGSGQTVTINGSSNGVRAFTVNSGATTVIENLTISGKKLSQSGGGILNSGNLTLLNDTITDSNAGTGGGIYNSGTLTATNCTIYNNSATNGGGIASLGTLKLISDTITGNSGGGVLTINSPTTYLVNSIIDGNSGLDFSNTFGAPVISGGGNLYGTSLQVPWMTTGSFPDLQNANPLLGSLQNNGGYTGTLSLLPGSPALGSGNPVNPSFGSLSSTDQRGYSRVIAGKTDIGAFQNQGQLFTLTAPSSESAPDAGTAATFNLGAFTYNGSGSPYSVAVDWGDGTSTTFSAASTGALPGQGHTYYAPGTYLATIRLTDVYANFAQSTATATIQGSLLVDTTGDTSAANASTSPVDSNGKVSLRSAIEYANATGYAGTISFLPGLSGTIELSGSLGNLRITDAGNLTIDASGASITVSGAGLSGITRGGVFLVNTLATDRIQNLTISGGNADSGGGLYLSQGNLTLSNVTIGGNSAGSPSSSKGFGGGIYNASSGTLTLTDDLITGNSASSSGASLYSASGGGLYNSGTLTVTDSTVDGNTTTGSGGGVFNAFGTATLDSDTIASNQAASAGGGIYTDGGTLVLTESTLAGNTAAGYFGGGLFNSAGNVTLSNDTISGNDSGKAAGAVYNTSGVLTMFNTIADGNTSLNAPDDVLNDSGGTFVSSGGNLYGPSSGMSWNTGGTYPDHSDPANNPGLGPLQNNGGPTQTLAELPGSLALGDGLLIGQGGATSTTTDQRGLTRVVNGSLDIGAFQNQSQLFTIVAPSITPGADAGNAAFFNLGSFSDSSASGNLWSVTVNWGDASADTVFSTTKQGTLPPQSHTYTASGNDIVTVIVNDADNNFAQQTFGLTVNPAISFSTTSLPNGTANAAYPTTQINASGGSGTLTYTASGGLDGLSLSSAGLLSGTPLAPDSFVFTVTATDALGATAHQAFGLTVNPAISISTTSIPAGTANAAYPTTQINASGGSGTLTYTASGDLDGLSLSSAGLLSGTPLVPGSFIFTVTATDAARRTAEQSYTLAVNAATTTGPTVTGLERFGIHPQQTALVLSFSTAMNPMPAQTLGNYTLVPIVHHHVARAPIALASAVYDSTNHTVSLRPARPIRLRARYLLTVNGTSPSGLTDTAGDFLAGANGQPGTSYVTTFGREILVSPFIHIHMTQATATHISTHSTRAAANAGHEIHPSRHARTSSKHIHN